MDPTAWYTACQGGDQEAWKKLNGFLLGVARKCAFQLDEADREDVVQQVLLEAHRALPASSDTPEAWVPRTVLRLKARLISLHRRRAQTPERLLTDPDQCPPVAAPDNPEQTLALRQALHRVFTQARETLGARCPKALDLYFRMKTGTDPDLEGIPDIAARLDITPNNASVVIHRCLARLLAEPGVAEALEGVVGSASD